MEPRLTTREIGAGSKWTYTITMAKERANKFRQGACRYKDESMAAGSLSDDRVGPLAVTAVSALRRFVASWKSVRRAIIG